MKRQRLVNLQNNWQDGKVIGIAVVCMLKSNISNDPKEKQTDLTHKSKQLQNTENNPEETHKRRNQNTFKETAKEMPNIPK